MTWRIEDISNDLGKSQTKEILRYESSFEA
jgi:hypothetical protein